ncbi:MAG: hypothetical protein AB7J40_03025 [Candidatus Altimarinota bacterium]
MDQIRNGQDREPSRSESAEKIRRLEQLVDQATHRVEQMGSEIDRASGEQQIIRRIMKGVVREVIADEEAQKIQMMRANRRKRISRLLLGGVLIGVVSYGVVVYAQPQITPDTIHEMKQKMRNLLGGILGYEDKDPAPDGSWQRMWVTPDEGRFLVAHRQKREQLFQVTEQLTQARLQQEKWKLVPEENPRRQTEIENWQAKGEELETQLSNLLREIRQSQLGFFEELPSGQEEQAPK